MCEKVILSLIFSDSLDFDTHENSRTKVIEVRSGVKVFIFLKQSTDWNLGFLVSEFLDQKCRKSKTIELSSRELLKNCN